MRVSLVEPSTFFTSFVSSEDSVLLEPTSIFGTQAVDPLHENRI